MKRVLYFKIYIKITITHNIRILYISNIIEYMCKCLQIFIFPITTSYTWKIKLINIVDPTCKIIYLDDSLTTVTLAAKCCLMKMAIPPNGRPLNIRFDITSLIAYIANQTEPASALVQI